MDDFPQEDMPEIDTAAHAVSQEAIDAGHLLGAIKSQVAVSLELDLALQLGNELLAIASSLKRAAKGTRRGRLRASEQRLHAAHGRRHHHVARMPAAGRSAELSLPIALIGA